MMLLILLRFNIFSQKEARDPQSPNQESRLNSTVCIQSELFTYKKHLSMEAWDLYSDIHSTLMPTDHYRMCRSGSSPIRGHHPPSSCLSLDHKMALVSLESMLLFFTYVSKTVTTESTVLWQKKCILPKLLSELIKVRKKSLRCVTCLYMLSI